MYTVFKNVWNTINSWYINNTGKLKPIADILVNLGTNAMNNKINKSVDYVSDEIGYDRVKQIANVVGNMVKNTMQNITNTVQRNDNSETGCDISDR